MFLSPNYLSKGIFMKFILILVLLLFQNCTVYRGSSVGVESAIDQQTKVVVVTQDGNRLKFKKLLKKDQHFIGVVKKRNTKNYLEENRFDYEKRGRFQEYNIDSLAIAEIYPKNKTVSTFVNIGIAVLSAITVYTTAVGIIFLSSWGG